MSYKRRKKLIRPRLQLRLIGAFLAVTAFSLLLQGMLMGSRMIHMAAELGDAGIAVTGQVPRLQFEVLGISALVILPLTLLVGVLVTFRVAGPVHRFEAFLAEVEQGRQVEPCRLRRGDELGDLCDRINRVTAAMREDNARGAGETDAPAPASTAA